MIKSMTGYGFASTEANNNRYSAEIKSLNSKFLELNLRLPKEFSDKELLLRNECGKLLERGKISITLSRESEDPASKAAQIDTALLGHYYRRLKEAAEKVDASPSNLFELAMNLPEVVNYAEKEAPQGEWERIHEVFLQAVQAFNEFRLYEGSVLQKDLQKRASRIMELQAEIAQKDQARVPMIREKLMSYMDQVAGKENVDMNRFEQELIYYIDKLDITEEKVRLDSHCNYFLSNLNADGVNGKKLGFISQEMGREINTMGSKANNAEIQQLVVQMKEELEKIKEQLLNIV